MRNGVEYVDSHRLPVSIVGMSGRRGGRPSARLMYNEQKSIIDDLVPLWNVSVSARTVTSTKCFLPTNLSLKGNSTNPFHIKVFLQVFWGTTA